MSGRFRVSIAAFLLSLVFSISAIADRPRFVRMEGPRLHYKSFGKGDEAVVFVHGAVSDMNSWRLQPQALEGKKRVILIDLPGHGQSDKPEVAYTMDLMATAIDTVLRDAGVRRAVLVGHSMGVAVVRQFYRRYPEKTRALVFLDGALRPLAPDQQIGESFLAPFRSPDYLKAADSFIDLVLTPQSPKELRAEIRASWERTPQHVIVSLFEQLILPQTNPELWKRDPIKVPTLAIYTKMPYVPPDNEQFFRSIVPDLEYKVMPEGVGHNVMIERPKEFNESLLAFLVRIEALQG